MLPFHLFPQSPDAKPNIAGGRSLAPHPSAFSAFATSFGLMESGNSRMRRSWATTLSFSFMRLLARSVRRALLAHYDFTHPDAQLCLLVRGCLLVGAGKGFGRSFHRMGDSWRKKNSPFVATQVTSRKAPAVTASIRSEPKL